jgi:hypothetical protein
MRGLLTSTEFQKHRLYPNLHLIAYSTAGINNAEKKYEGQRSG